MRKKLFQESHRVIKLRGTTFYRTIVQHEKRINGSRKTKKRTKLVDREKWRAFRVEKDRAVWQEEGRDFGGTVR